jgi:hypothetical protein
MSRPRGRNDEWQLYAIAEGSLPSRLRLAERSLTTFQVNSVSIIAGAPPDLPIEDALRDQHNVVLELAERFDPILPIRFGQRMTSVRLLEVVAPFEDALARGLAHVRGRQQMTVRLLGLATPERRRASSGTDYLAQRRGELALPADAIALEDALAPLVVDRRVQPGRERVRLTLFHLVNRSDVASYQAAAMAVEPRISPWRLSVSGPWPPFAFAPEVWK